MKGDADDPKALIHEAYRIDGITEPQCRAIFFDWALGLPGEEEPRAVIGRVLEQYKGDNPDHPMTAVLTEGLGHAARPKRRGGWKSRRPAD